MVNRKVLIIVVALQLILPVAAIACPKCSYSPNGWGFCGYGGYAGPYDCKTVVADAWTGRTKCNMCGYCNWNDPNGSQACNADGGGDGDCGLDTPCDQSLNRQGLPAGSCSGPNRIAGSNDLSWMGARIDQIAIF